MTSSQYIASSLDDFSPDAEDLQSNDTPRKESDDDDSSEVHYSDLNFDLGLPDGRDDDDIFDDIVDFDEGNSKSDFALLKAARKAAVLSSCANKQDDQTEKTSMGSSSTE